MVVAVAQGSMVKELVAPTKSVKAKPSFVIVSVSNILPHSLTMLCLLHSECS